MLDAIVERVIATEVEHQMMQVRYFRDREKVGEVLTPKVYQPKHEPEATALAAVFVEPGAVHLVFRDEVGPTSGLDSWYREVRQKVFGRVHDVESVEVIDGQLKFIGNAAFINVYETSLHWSTVEPSRGAIFSETWNHMLSAGGKWLNILRGGYRLVEAPVQEGGRDAAERWSPSE
ncbi:hypothetical protein LCGC14_1195390 [marine sediment metagenome]|uniref:Uncharacterized protein n=1 Tax=marine sediment metagenome TaxID=412755 RepID=A0A0F9PNF9_9ZZZZ